MSTESDSVWLVSVIENGIEATIGIYGTEEAAEKVVEELTKNFKHVKVTEWEIH
ncbi:MAG: hypothetical protein KAS38_15585 [Anaerolineales bacterium]|nr:hypothetical protein [Anaerolineales bacterium]MCK5485479.1 hypothetical protein [Desulfobacterales bacterium]